MTKSCGHRLMEILCSWPALCAFLRLPNIKVTPEFVKLINCAWMAAIYAHLRSDVGTSNVDVFRESCITDILEDVDEDGYESTMAGSQVCAYFGHGGLEW